MEAAWSCWECLERLTLAVALQLVAVAYGVNSFSKPLEDLESCMVKLLECLRNPGHRLGIVTSCSRFVADGAPLLKTLLFSGYLNGDHGASFGYDNQMLMLQQGFVGHAKMKNVVIAGIRDEQQLGRLVEIHAGDPKEVDQTCSRHGVLVAGFMDPIGTRSRDCRCEAAAVCATAKSEQSRCGCGTIPFEAAECLGGQVMCLAGLKEPCDVLHWDAARLPLRTGCVDRIICDMPYGVRCGKPYILQSGGQYAVVEELEWEQWRIPGLFSDMRVLLIFPRVSIYAVLQWLTSMVLYSSSICHSSFSREKAFKAMDAFLQKERYEMASGYEAVYKDGSKVLLFQKTILAWNFGTWTPKLRSGHNGGKFKDSDISHSFFQLYFIWKIVMINKSVRCHASYFFRAGGMNSSSGQGNHHSLVHEKVTNSGFPLRPLFTSGGLYVGIQQTTSSTHVTQLSAPSSCHMSIGCHSVDLCKMGQHANILDWSTGSLKVDWDVRLSGDVEEEMHCGRLCTCKDKPRIEYVVVYWVDNQEWSKQTMCSFLESE
eukprot:Gb_32437 [translate_table: standard]